MHLQAPENAHNRDTDVSSFISRLIFLFLDSHKRTVPRDDSSMTFATLELQPALLPRETSKNSVAVSITVSWLKRLQRMLDTVLQMDA